MKCAGVGVAKLSKNAHVRCGNVRSEKLLCAECAGVPKLPAHKYSVHRYWQARSTCPKCSHSWTSNLSASVGLNLKKVNII